MAAESELLDRTAAFYQMQLHRHGEAIEYLHHRGLQDSGLIVELGLGYARGGDLTTQTESYHPIPMRLQIGPRLLLR
jgi:hypothetical protein